MTKPVPGSRAAVDFSMPIWRLVLVACVAIGVSVSCGGGPEPTDEQPTRQDRPTDTPDATTVERRVIGAPHWLDGEQIPGLLRSLAGTIQSTGAEDEVDWEAIAAELGYADRAIHKGDGLSSRTELEERTAFRRPSVFRLSLVATPEPEVTRIADLPEPMQARFNDAATTLRTLFETRFGEAAYRGLPSNAPSYASLSREPALRRWDVRPGWSIWLDPAVYRPEMQLILEYKPAEAMEAGNEAEPRDEETDEPGPVVDTNTGTGSTDTDNSASDTDPSTTSTGNETRPSDDWRDSIERDATAVAAIPGYARLDEAPVDLRELHDRTVDRIAAGQFRTRVSITLPATPQRGTSRLAMPEVLRQVRLVDATPAVVRVMKDDGDMRSVLWSGMLASSAALIYDTAIAADAPYRRSSSGLFVESHLVALFRYAYAYGAAPVADRRLKEWIEAEPADLDRLERLLASLRGDAEQAYAYVFNEDTGRFEPQAAPGASGTDNNNGSAGDTGGVVHERDTEARRAVSAMERALREPLVGATITTLDALVAQILPTRDSRALELAVRALDRQRDDRLDTMRRDRLPYEEVRDALRSQLAEARRQALGAIRNERAYYKTGNQATGQATVDSAIETLRQLWTDPSQLALNELPEIAQIVEESARMTGWMQQLGAAPDVVAEHEEALATLMTNLRENTALNSDDADPNARSLRQRHVVTDTQNARDRTATERERAFAAMLNDYRHMLGLEPLALVAGLTEASRAHSEYMKESGEFAHQIDGHPHGASPTERAFKFGYRGGVAENITFNSQGHSPQSAFDSWYNSPPHHRNMIGETHTKQGVGDAGTHWTTLFG